MSVTTDVVYNYIDLKMYNFRMRKVLKVDFESINVLLLVPYPK